MNSYMVAPGIRFNDYLFTEPKQLSEWERPRYAGILAILVRDPNWAPKPFQALFFREFGNNSQEILLSNGLMRLPGTLAAERFWVSVLPVPFSTTAQRLEILQQLIWAYNPAWQAKGSAAEPSELARKLEELEKKHEEQTTQVRLLLQSFNKFFEPQPEPPRRRIGFLPQPVTAA
jgi:hypothetical protein